VAGIWLTRRKHPWADRLSVCPRSDQRLFVRLSAFFRVVLNSLFMYAGALGAGLNPEMVVLGTVVLMGPGDAVYAAPADRHLVPRLREQLHLGSRTDQIAHVH
jgi:hypothetical protein